jgi:hypothetical protein
MKPSVSGRLLNVLIDAELIKYNTNGYSVIDDAWASALHMMRASR